MPAIWRRYLLSKIFLHPGKIVCEQEKCTGIQLQTASAMHWLLVASCQYALCVSVCLFVCVCVRACVHLGFDENATACRSQRKHQTVQYSIGFNGRNNNDLSLPG